jgi:hypothetical protein
MQPTHHRTPLLLLLPLLVMGYPFQLLPAAAQQTELQPDYLDSLTYKLQDLQQLLLLLLRCVWLLLQLPLQPLQQHGCGTTSASGPSCLQVLQNSPCRCWCCFLQEC